MSSAALLACAIAIAATSHATGGHALHAHDKKRRPRTNPSPIKCRDGTTVVPYVPPSREEQIKRLKDQAFDVLVVGGGCVGSGVALDAAQRGLRTAMIEAEDFGAG